MTLWIASMECAGIAEAGGVKNVTYSLCKEFSALNHKAILFIPVFGCNSWNDIKNLTEVGKVDISLCEKSETVIYSKGLCISGNFEVVFINHKIFQEKEAIYTYTEKEQAQNPQHIKGNGHTDSLYMDSFFQKAVAAYCNFADLSEKPDIIHCQDASTALIPAFIKQYDFFSKTNCVVTIHNAGPAYHHEFSCFDEAEFYTNLPPEILKNSQNGNRVEPFLIAANCNAKLTTVSEKYAEEISNPENANSTDGLSPLFYSKKIKITGITNGFDFSRYNPSRKKESLLPFAFSPANLNLEGKYKCRSYFLKNTASKNSKKIEGIKKYGFIEADSGKEIFLCYHGRITSQKGITILTDSIPQILTKNSNLRFVIAGQGEQSLEEKLISLSNSYSGKIMFLNGYERLTVRLCTAISDFIVLPSFFEPCGLEDFIAQTFATLPIAHKTGGLTKIIDGKTGFLYEENTAGKLSQKILEVTDLFCTQNEKIKQMIQNAAIYVKKEFNWKNVIKKYYLPFFKNFEKNSKK